MSGQWFESGMRRVVGVSVLLSLCACAGYTPRVSTAEVPTSQDAYLYGRFHIHAPTAWLGMDGHASMGFSLQCADQQKYVLRFDKDKPVLAIKVKPSTCTMTEIVYTNADGQVRGRKPAPAGGAFKNMRFEAGHAYYMGDFDAGTSSSFSGTTSHFEWFIKSTKDNYDLTTKDMRADYPNLGHITTQNQLIPKPEQVRAEYERIVARIDAKEYKVRHILVAKQAEAQAALARIRAGESFESVAREVSKDPGSSKEGGELGWNASANFVPAFSKGMVSLAPRGLSREAVMSPFGWHVIEVTGERAAPVPPFEEVKDKIAERLRNRALSG